MRYLTLLLLVLMTGCLQTGQQSNQRPMQPFFSTRADVGSRVLGSPAPVYQQQQSGGFSNETVGNVLGGVAGALGGRYVARSMGYGDNGRLIGTLLGGGVGAMFGGSVGRSLDRADHAAMQAAQVQVLDSPMMGQPVDWDGREYGSQTGAQGMAVVTRQGRNQRTGAYCREFTTRAFIGQQMEDMVGVACRNPDGTWSMVQ